LEIKKAAFNCLNEVSLCCKFKLYTGNSNRNCFTDSLRMFGQWVIKNFTQE